MNICAVIVTYNRKELLLRCIKSILSQNGSKVDKILIIDNASTDGVRDYLIDNKILSTSDEFFHDNIAVEYVRLESNIGGAGGFNKGLSIAFKQGFDFYWVMDDDGYPADTCLQHLLKYTEQFDFLSPLVLNEKNHEKLSFGINGVISLETIHKLYFDVDVIANKANPFNGVLFSRKMLDLIGLPKSDMFIWGDENEYQQRALKAGVNIGTVKDAFHFHPENRVNSKLIFNRIKVNLPEDSLRRYCYFRNYTYIIKKYSTKASLMRWFAKYILFFVITFDFNGLSLFFKAAGHALTNDFTHHREYLK
ncbi:glycosyltransferase family 2 protein [Enterobacteriaceae bacterium BIT-l23]|uniref:glycosyltransferase family 2 protein n=1 Tax=Jejubacter sp. L23 TaxID=3092086 RepID=UPI001585640A|nr:glycosyltransferase family 2 protein [Enterobacteriaceae bacterium BIT-l23]